MIEGLEQKSPEACAFVEGEPIESHADEPELYLRAVLDACASGVAVLGESGTILYVNGAWREFASRHGLVGDVDGVGLDYLEVCRMVSDAPAEDAAAIAEGIRQIMLGEEAEYQREYFCHHLTADQCVLIHATRLSLPRAVRVLVTHEDIALSRHAVEARKKD